MHIGCDRVIRPFDRQKHWKRVLEASGCVDKTYTKTRDYMSLPHCMTEERIPGCQGRPSLEHWDYIV